MGDDQFRQGNRNVFVRNKAVASFQTASKPKCKQNCTWSSFTDSDERPPVRLRVSLSDRALPYIRYGSQRVISSGPFSISLRVEN